MIWGFGLRFNHKRKRDEGDHMNLIGVNRT